MTTYTIAYDAEADLLIACEPDGSADTIECRVCAHIDALEAIGESPAEIEYHHGLTLTDELQDDDEPVYTGTSRGHLMDAVGKTYFFAVNRKTAT